LCSQFMLKKAEAPQDKNEFLSVGMLVPDDRLPQPKHSFISNYNYLLKPSGYNF
jgi:hypothetical protein